MKASAVKLKNNECPNKECCPSVGMQNKQVPRE